MTDVWPPHVSIYRVTTSNGTQISITAHSPIEAADLVVEAFTRDTHPVIEVKHVERMLRRPRGRA